MLWTQSTRWKGTGILAGKFQGLMSLLPTMAYQLLPMALRLLLLRKRASPLPCAYTCSTPPTLSYLLRGLLLQHLSEKFYIHIIYIYTNVYAYIYIYHRSGGYGDHAVFTSRPQEGAESKVNLCLATPALQALWEDTSRVDRCSWPPGARQRQLTSVAIHLGWQSMSSHSRACTYPKTSASSKPPLKKHAPPCAI